MKRIIAILLLSLALLAGLFTATPASAGYWDDRYVGARWATLSGPVCYQYKGIDQSSAARSAVKEAVVNIHNNTKLWLRWRYDCSGHAKRVILYDGYYGKTSYACYYACTEWKGGFSWGTVPTKGDWTAANGYTWRIKSPVVIKFNLSNLNSLSYGRKVSIGAHEVLHTNGLDHLNVCDTVLQASLSTALKRGCTIYRNATARDRRDINALYANG